MENTENKFKYNGLWYIAIEQEGCRNCAFREWRHCTSPDPHDGKVPHCAGINRNDMKDVIFVESDADNYGDDE